MSEQTVKKMLWIVPIGFVILFCIFSIASGSANIGIRSFAVDSKDILYVGTYNHIEVYEQGKMIHTISPQTSRGYVFTITENDTILLSTGDVVYLISTDGNEIETLKEHAGGVYTELQFHKNEFTSKNYDVYTLKNKFGRTKIVKNDTETVYKISVFSFIVKILLYISTAGILLLVLHILLLPKRQKKG